MLKLVVIIRDESPLIHLGDPPTYRKVVLELTDSQQEALSLKVTGAVAGRDIRESFGNVFLE